MSTMSVYISYHPGTLGLVFDALSCILVDSDVPKKVSSSDNAVSLVPASWPTIMVEPFFLTQVS